MPNRLNLKKDEFRCAMCNKVFTKGVSDEEAFDKFHEEFPDIPIEDTDLICDDCYRIITIDMKRKPWKYGL
jgi:hypothetical protein